jgi:RNA polymerase sigma-70 factor (ECF subfamily)
VALLERAAAADDEAEGLLFRRCEPLVRRMAQGRLPHALRDIKVADALVQETLVIAFQRLREFEPRREGAFIAHVRQVLVNQVRQEVRRRRSQALPESLTETGADRATTLHDERAWVERLGRYDRLLEGLGAEQREAVILRVELEYSYPRIADATGQPSGSAARMMVARTLALLAWSMGGDGGQESER